MRAQPSTNNSLVVQEMDPGSLSMLHSMLGLSGHTFCACPKRKPLSLVLARQGTLPFQDAAYLSKSS